MIDHLYAFELEIDNVIDLDSPEELDLAIESKMKAEVLSGVINKLYTDIFNYRAGKTREALERILLKDNFILDYIDHINSQVTYWRNGGARYITLGFEHFNGYVGNLLHTYKNLKDAYLILKDLVKYEDSLITTQYLISNYQIRGYFEYTLNEIRKYQVELEHLWLDTDSGTRVKYHLEPVFFDEDFEFEVSEDEKVKLNKLLDMLNNYEIFKELGIIW